jgi:hypothetical protein
MSAHDVSVAVTKAEGYLARAKSATDPRVAQHWTDLADHELAVAQVRHEELKQANT